MWGGLRLPLAPVQPTWRHSGQTPVGPALFSTWAAHCGEVASAAATTASFSSACTLRTEWGEAGVGALRGFGLGRTTGLEGALGLALSGWELVLGWDLRPTG